MISKFIFNKVRTIRVYKQHNVFNVEVLFNQIQSSQLSPKLLIFNLFIFFLSVHMNVQDLAAYVLTIEIQSPLDLILLRSPVMLDIVDSGEQHGMHLLLLFVI